MVSCDIESLGGKGKKNFLLTQWALHPLKNIYHIGELSPRRARGVDQLMLENYFQDVCMYCTLHTVQ